MLVVDNVSLSFRGLRALDGVSLSIVTGEMVGIIGPNGINLRGRRYKPP